MFAYWSRYGLSVLPPGLLICPKCFLFFCFCCEWIMIFVRVLMRAVCLFCSTMSHRQFYTALRYIAMIQCGVSTISKGLACICFSHFICVDLIFIVCQCTWRCAGWYCKLGIWNTSVRRSECGTTRYTYVLIFSEAAFEWRLVGIISLQLRQRLKLSEMMGRPELRACFNNTMRYVALSLSQSPLLSPSSVNDVSTCYWHNLGFATTESEIRSEDWKGAKWRIGYPKKTALGKSGSSQKYQ